MLHELSQKILKFNKELDESQGDNPTIINSDPYGDGWIIKIELADPEDRDLLGHLLTTARTVAEQEGVADRDKGFRLVINNGTDGGESVPHLHVHLLAGRQLNWPPG